MASVKRVKRVGSSPLAPNRRKGSQAEARPGGSYRKHLSGWPLLLCQWKEHRGVPIEVLVFHEPGYLRFRREYGAPEEVERAALEVARLREAAPPEARRAVEARLEMIRTLAGEPPPVEVGERSQVVALALRLARLVALAQPSEEAVEMLTAVALGEGDSGALVPAEVGRLAARLQSMAFVLLDTVEALESPVGKRVAA